MRKMSDFSTTELLHDLQDSNADIAVCQKALSQGITNYSGGTVVSRLTTNERIKIKIEEELKRRGICP
jgi:hypothetical protein